MNKLLLTIIMLMCLQKIFAQQLIIETIDGETQTIALTSQPKITIKNGELIIASDESEISLPVQSVSKYTFSQVDDSGIKQIENTEAPFSMSDNRIIFNSSQSSRNVMFYSVGGVLLRSFTIRPGSGGYFDISSLVPGVYIVRVNDITVKIVKR